MLCTRDLQDILIFMYCTRSLFVCTLLSKLRDAPLMASKEARPAGDCEVERAERPFSCGTRAAAAGAR